MHIAPVRSPRKKLSMTPLVDVIFLLLMFFMLSSTFSKYASLELGRTTDVNESPAQTSTSQTGGKAVFVTISPQGKVQVNGTPVVLSALVSKLNALHEAGARAIIIVPKRGANVQNLVSVVERTRTSRIKVVSIAN